MRSRYRGRDLPFLVSCHIARLKLKLPDDDDHATPALVCAESLYAVIIRYPSLACPIRSSPTRAHPPLPYCIYAYRFRN